MALQQIMHVNAPAPNDDLAMKFGDLDDRLHTLECVSLILGRAIPKA